jgi:hypothetical protein
MQLMPLIAMGMVSSESSDKSSDAGKGAAQTPEFVEIAIRFTDGMPWADPDSAQVRVNGKITWHTETGVNTAFKIVPKLGWLPEHASAETFNALSLSSHWNKDKQQEQVVAGAGAHAGTFPYAIEANGYTVDPDVVIKPQ